MPDIPFPQAPAPAHFEAPNPLQSMAHMQGLAAQAQAMQQRQQMMDAQNALGQVMQESVDPESGEIDMHQVLSKGAANPALRPIYSQMLKDSLAQGLVKEQTLNSQLEARSKELDLMGKFAAGELEEAARTGRKDGMMPSFLAKLQSAGVIDGRQGVKYLQMFGQAKQNKVPEDSILRGIVSHSAQGMEALKTSGLDLKTLTAQTEFFDTTPGSPTEGQKRLAPAYMVPGALSPGQQEAMGRGAPQEAAPQEAGQPMQLASPMQQDAAGGGSAPPSGLAARQEGVPSPPPAALGRAAEPPLWTKREEEARHPDSPWAKLKDEVHMGATAAQQSQMAISETRDLVKDLTELGKSGTGPTAELRMKAAKLTNEAQSLAEGMKDDDVFKKPLVGALNSLSKKLTGSDNPKEWAGAAEALQKLGALTAIGGLRQAVGSANKVTQQEVLKFMEIFPSLTSSPAGIKRMLNYMEKVNDALINRENHLNFYEQQNKRDRNKGYNPTQLDQEWTDILRRRGVIRFDGGEE